MPVQDLNAVRQELPRHIAATRAERGCRVFEVTELGTPPGRFSVVEEFASREAFESHQQRVAKSHWGKVTARALSNYAITQTN